MNTPVDHHDASAIQSWLLTKLSERLGVASGDISIHDSFADYGLDSAEAVSLAGELEEWLGIELAPTIAYEYPSIAGLSQYLAGLTAIQPAVESAVPAPHHAEPIAIVGIGCRFPGGANDPESFWALLRDGVDAIRLVPNERWNLSAFYDPDPQQPGKLNTRWGGFLEQIDQFDPAFFKITPREALRMDPQQRLLLEVSWEALEDAGLAVESLAASQTGVFIGISSNEYSQLQFSAPTLIDAYAGTGNALSIAANRLSYTFDFRGPSVAIDTACSSSLVAVHLACQSLRNGESQLAIAGGVNLLLSPAVTINFTKAGVMAPDGRCKTFDASANGYVRSEGVGVVVLKPLSRALADDDSIYAVICGSAVNQDGRSNGLMAPNRQSQEAVLRLAYARAGIQPSEVDYIEAHGTGTLLGDSIEASALGAVIAASADPDHVCRVGSVKTNIGHLEAAAGIAGLIKVALALRHRTIPASLHFHRPNPHIPFEELPLRVQHERTAWPTTAHPARAGVSSFGFGGTNAHMVLEEAPSILRNPQQIVAQPEQLLTLSAHSPDALRALAGAYRDMLLNQVSPAAERLPDLCYSASVRRSHLDWRLACVATKEAELAEQLTGFVDGQTAANLVASATAVQRPPQVVFVFPGQGSQWVGMGRQLLAHEPVVRDVLEQCDQVMRQYVPWSLLEQLTADQDQSHLDQIDVVQPVLFALQVALAALWRSWGITPTALIGHSMGEVAAAHIAGILSLDDAARIICRRSRLLRQISGQGSMAAVELSLAEAQQALLGYEDRVSIAAANSPTSVVLSGDTSALQELLATFEQRNLFCRLIKVDVASHSPQTEVLRDQLLEALAAVQPQSAQIPLYSTVTGQRCNGSELDASYWVRNLREPVLFSPVVQELISQGEPIFVEISAHPILLSAIQQGFYQLKRPSLGLPSLRRDESERGVLLKSLAELYVRGAPVNWKQVYAQRGRRIPLPSYPWQHESFWFETPELGTSQAWQHVGRQRPAGSSHPFGGSHRQVAAPAHTWLWETVLSKQQFSYLQDHKVQNVVLLPGTAYLELALAAATETFGAHVVSISAATFQRALFWPDQEERMIQVLLGSHGAEHSYQIYSASASEAQQRWTLHAFGSLQLSLDRLATPERPTLVLDEIRRRCQDPLFGVDYYLEVWEAGTQYGPAFQSIQQLWRHEHEALGHLQVPGMLVAQVDQYHVHPAVLDACLQVLGATIPTDDDDSSSAGIYLPVFIDRIRLHGPISKQLWSYARLRSDEGQPRHALEGDVWVVDQTGAVVIEVEGIRLQRLDSVPQASTGQKVEDWLYEIRWQPDPRQVDLGQAPLAEAAGVWLLFADRQGMAEALAEQLTAAGGQPVLVFASDRFAHHALDRYEIRPGNADDLALLLDHVFDRAPAERALVHLWSLDAPTSEQMSVAELEQAQQVGCGSVLSLVQALARRSWQSHPRLWLITAGAQLIDEQPRRLALAQAPLWGFGRTIAQEHATIWGGLIDLDPAADYACSARWLAQALCQPDVEDQLVLREDRRYVARLVRKPPAAASSATLRWRADGSYLITGGLGDLGLQIARWMVEQGARRLILMGRSGLPPRAQWRHVPAQSDLAQRVAAVRELEALGASVQIAAVDVADATQLSAFFANYEAEAWPPICGVVHAAGVVDLKTIVELGADDLQRILRPKVSGAWLLQQHLAQSPLDFFVLFSSATALLSSPRLAHYAAANAFLDALAHDRRAQGQTAVSINWALWDSVGMAARHLQDGHVMLRGIESFTPQQGLQALELILSQGWTQVGVMRVNWQAWQQTYAAFSQVPLFSQLIARAGDTGRQEDAQASASALRDTLLQLAEPERQQRVETYLSEQVAAVLGLSVAKLDRQQSFSNLGIDSIMAVELKNRIENDLGIAIPIVSFIQGPSIAQLSAEVFDQLSAAGSGSAPSGAVLAVPLEQPRSSRAM